jgi:Fe-S cluster assembly protein SufB
MRANVREERVEPAALKGDYQFGFHEPDQSVFRARKGLDREIVEPIPAIKGEPTWMRDIRLKAFNIFLQKPMPAWGGNVAKMNFDDIYDYVKPSDREGRTWDDVPENIKKTFDRLGIPEAEKTFLASVGA